MIITPYKNNIFSSGRSGGLTLNSIYSTYSFTNMWSAENINVSGGTTTVYDYAGEHDLANIGGEQPTLTANNSNFNNKPTLNFNGGEGLEKAVANWRNGDSGGMVTFVILKDTATAFFPLSSADNSVVNSYFGVGNTTSGSILIRNGGGGGFGRISNIANNFQYGLMVGTIGSTGTGYKIFINGIGQDIDPSDPNDGDWFADIGGRDDIVIGKISDSSPTYGFMDWALTSYKSSLDSDADIVAMHQDFMTYYGMTIPLAMSQLDQLNGVINGWNYNFLNVNGTTTTAFDLKGQYDMSNPASANQPTLNSTNLEFRTDDYLSNSVSNYSSGNTTGVVHCYAENVSSGIYLCVSDSSVSAEYFLFYQPSGKIRLADTIGASSDLQTTNTFTGYNVISFVQDGVQLKIYVDGVEITDFDISTLTSEWFNTTTDILTIGALIRPSSFYGGSNWKATIHSQYVSQAKAIEEATTILNSGL